MAASVERSCSMIVHYDKPSSQSEIKEALEGSDDDAKVVAMKKAVTMLLNGEPLPQLFITIVRYVLPSENHTIQKLLLLYLEAIEKTDANGKILPEMILICQNLRNNLQHPNEYLRGVTLRFLCRLQCEELLEPLVPSVLACLEHRHSYVRRHAVLAVAAIYKLPKGELLLPDAPETLERFLASEQDLSARRNAFVMLAQHATDRAVRYLYEHVDQVTGWGDILQMAVLELLRKVCAKSPAEKGRHMKVILALLQSQYAAVVYECACTLTALSQAPTAVRAAAGCLCQLLVSQSDNNVKLIILDRLSELKERHREVLQDMLMDVLRALSSPVLDIRQKALDLALQLVTPRTIDDVVGLLKRELVRTAAKELERGPEYRQMLVQAIHSCAVRFPAVAGSVVEMLTDFLSDASSASALEVVYFMREVVETNSGLRAGVLERLRDTLPAVRNARVAGCALWVLGEYSASGEDIRAALAVIRAGLGPLPLVPADGDDTSDQNAAAAAPAAAPAPVGSKRPAVLADGTYASQTAVVEAIRSAADTPATANLRALLLGGDFFVGGILASTLTKLVLRLRALGSPAAAVNAAAAEAMLIIVAVMRLGASSSTALPLDDDSRDRMATCLRVLAQPPDQETMQVWLRDCKAAFASLTSDKARRQAAEAAAAESKMVSQPDDLIDFVHLKARRGLSQLEIEDAVSADLAAATGYGEAAGTDRNRLSRVLQLTGFSDPLYAEAYVTVHAYDVVMDITITNRTNETLQGVSLELATMGDLKLVDRPQPATLAPHASRTIRANIKVSSTETGVIFGNLVYEGGGAAEKAVVVLADVHLDILDYITPATVADAAFRSMWAEFEWENKVAIATSFTDVRAFLDHIVAATHMKCLTPSSALEGEAGVLAANLYARSVFGEDALVNLCVEAGSDGKLAGYIRIRSKTQGIALSLGDKITIKQKGPAPGQQ